ncbi:CopD family protein [Niveispirillum irakense]|uniref:CopD family protein n=1 Tax=Niveispirillum irakense TaxID=34011 RepID=UPI0003FBACC4|nr:CopD family protein [Niveispirillum irakense]
MIALLKFIHIAAIAIWAGGLLALPLLYARRFAVPAGDELFRLQGVVRFSYVMLLSPAAFIAVGSGTALIFLRETFVAWFSLKLAFVALLVLMHIASGLIIIRLFKEDAPLPRPTYPLVGGTILMAVLAILFLVLAKPDIDPAALLPRAMAEPGALRGLLSDLNPWTTP